MKRIFISSVMLVIMASCVVQAQNLVQPPIDETGILLGGAFQFPNPSNEDLFEGVTYNGIAKAISIWGYWQDGVDTNGGEQFNVSMHKPNGENLQMFYGLSRNSGAFEGDRKRAPTNLTGPNGETVWKYSLQIPIDTGEGAELGDMTHLHIDGINFNGTGFVILEGVGEDNTHYFGGGTTSSGFGKITDSRTGDLAFALYAEVPCIDDQPNAAYNVWPVDGISMQSIDETLFWGLNDPNGNPVEDVLFNVYFGSDPNAVANPMIIEGENVYSVDPEGVQDLDTTYYWFVETIAYDVNEITGEEDYSIIGTSCAWSFTTIPPKAIEPTPFNGDENAAANQILSWVSPPGTIGSEVFFGVPGSMESLGDLGGDSIAASDVDLPWDTAYEWRVDITTANGTIEGEVWTFTTADGPVCDPELPGDANNDCVLNLSDIAIIASDWLACTKINATCP